MTISVCTFILIGEAAMEFGNNAVDDYDSFPVRKVTDLAPEHVNTARLYLGPLTEELRAGVWEELVAVGAAYQPPVEVRHDDPLVWGQP